MELANSLKDKFFKVLMHLTRTKEEFEMVADEVEECNLKTALHGLSLESSIYASELCQQLQSLGISLNTPPSPELTGANGMPSHATIPGKGNELHYLCSKSEDFIIAAYRSILNECRSLPGIYELMKYQLNALKLAFTKIKMLNAARFNFKQERISLI